MDNSIVGRVSEFIKKNMLLHKDDHVIVGLSGGADSVCLLHVLYNLKNEFGLKLTAIHVNHMIRGEEALRDEEYAVRFCKDLGIDIIVERVDVIKLSYDMKISEEEAGRIARYNIFRKYKESFGASKIAVAHNKNDNAETVIMNIVRGCGINGLKGIDCKRGYIIRPLIILKREEIEEYCRINNLSYVTDSTNVKPIYTRNKIRLKLIKIIDDTLDVDVVSRIDKMSKLAREDNDFMTMLAKKAFRKCVIGNDKDLVLLDVNKLKKEHKAIKRRIILEAILKVKKDLRMIECKHIQNILDLVDGKTGRSICLPCKIKVFKSYDVLRFSIGEERKKDLDILNIDISKDGGRVVGKDFVLEIKVLDYKDKEIYKSDKYVKFFDYEKLGDYFEIRRRHDGDIFKPLNSNGTKKLKKYFIDKKVDRLERDKFYLLTKGKEVIWIIGDRVSDDYKITKNTRKIVRVEFNSVI